MFNNPISKTGRSSEWRVMTRCFRLLLILMRTEPSRAALIDVIRDDAQVHDEPINERALTKRFNNDMSRLRTQFGAVIDYDHATKRYRLESLDSALIDLPDEAMRGLSFLQATFGDPGTPYGGNVQALIDRVKSLLAERRRSEVDRMTGQLELDLHPRDDDAITDQTWDVIWRACREQRQIEFNYMSKNDSQAWRRHVEPERYYFDDGHYYLVGHCLRKQAVEGWLTVNKYRQYRIGRMSDTEVLPTRNRHLPMRPTAELRVLVRPFLVKQGVPRLTSDDVVTMHPDGQATIEARPDNLFMTLRQLLRYGEHMKVIGNDAAVAQMRELVNELYAVYSDNEHL